MSKKKQANQTNDIALLEQGKLLAFELKYKGFTYDQIAEHEGIPYTSGTLSAYLRPNGDWYVEYREWVSAMTRDANEQIKDMFTAQALEAMQRVINFAHGVYEVAEKNSKGEVVKVRLSVKDVTALKANQDILDRAGFKPPETIAFEAESKAEEAARWFEEMGKKKRAAKENAQ